MKKIEAIIRKSKFDDVVKALHDADVHFFSYWDVTGVGNEKVGKVYRGITSSTKVGDGKIFVLPCDEAYRIRTGERGTKSLN